MSIEPPASTRSTTSTASTPQRGDRGDRGAALIVALGVMTVLFAISITFFQMTRQEQTTATNVSNRVRAELLADGALAVAIAFLNHDLITHPTYTALDHAWQTYFNGAWFQQADANGNWIGPKSWAIVPGTSPPLPEIDLAAMPDVLIPGTDAGTGPTFDVDNNGTPDARFEPLYSGLTRDWVYIPRAAATPTPLLSYKYNNGQWRVENRLIDTNGDGLPDQFPRHTGPNPPAQPPVFVAEHPFVLPADLNPDLDVNPTDPALTPSLTRAQIIHQWADVDNDGDGLRDSVWLPIGVDRFYDDDGIDNNLNAAFLCCDGFDNDGDGIVDEPDEGYDEPGEVGLFVYWGGDDGLDNDCDGQIDEGDEQSYFKTVPNPFQFPDGTPIAFPWAFADNPFDDITPHPSILDPRIDCLDNDLDIFVNNGLDVRNQVNPGFQDAPGSFVMANFYGINALDATTRVYAEPVSTLAGRMAILIRDESSKVNVDTTSGFSFVEQLPAPLPGNVDRGINQGATTHEYEARWLPWTNPTTPPAFIDQSVIRAHDFRMGAPFGVTGLNTGGDPNNDFIYDKTFPGYGRVDDNGNAFWLAINGIDDDGDGLVDEGVEFGVLSFDTAGAPVDTLFGVFEGIDEPGEYRRFRPKRNLPAETDGIDNDGDGAVDEIGELGDQYYRTREQLKDVEDIGTTLYNRVSNFITTHSSDKNERHAYKNPQLFGITHSPQFRAVSGVKVDLNVALAREIAEALQADHYFGFEQTISSDGVPLPKVLNDEYIVGGQTFPVPGNRRPSALSQVFAQGLRREGLSYVLSPVPGQDQILGGLYATAPGQLQPYGDLPDGPAGENRYVILEEDPELRALKIAANAKDNRDTDHHRTELSTTVRDDWFDIISGGIERDITYTVSGAESIVINEIMVRPVRRIEAEMTFSDDPTTAGPPDPPTDFSQEFDPAPVAGMPVFSVFAETLSNRIGATGDWQRVGPHIGDQSYLEISRGRVGPDDSDPSAPYDVVQFRIRSTPQGLPPGRYYMTINSSTTGKPAGTTITQFGTNTQIRYAVKYVARPGFPAAPPFTDSQDIIQDTIDFFPPTSDGTKDLDTFGYWREIEDAFIGKIQDGSDDPTGWAFLPTDEAPNPAPDIDGYEQNDAYTIQVPSITDSFDLYVAFRMELGTSGSIAINFFDFSQEPDHEWIELVNIQEDVNPSDTSLDINPVDLSGWQLEIGYGQNDQHRKVLTIPPGTQIAPGGSLLLGVNKFDDFQTDPTAVPPVFSHDPLNLIYNNGIGLARGDVFHIGTPDQTGAFANVTVPPIVDANDGSIFVREASPTLTDYHDWDGDASSNNFARVDNAEQRIASTRGGNGVLDGLGSPVGSPTDEDKAWDRIVELESPDIDLVGSDLTLLAELVLAGGIFPNYPEFDGIDNDGDNAILQNDGVDNNFSGSADDADEGIDEHRVPYETSGLPVPGGFSLGFVANLQVASTVLGGTSQSRPFETATFSPPEWKEFVERRFLPGDNVIVTLYEGPSSGGRIADRVTYNQRDVENAAIDDVVTFPYYEDANNNGIRDTGETLFPGLEGLPNVESRLWPDNTMGFDFYRSLERRHPLYPGDRFGTQNRWQATDGNYDDWAPSTHLFESDFGTFTARATLPPALAALYTHAFSGSPLRANLPHRLKQNLNNQFRALSGPALSEASTTQWAFDRARIRNKNYVSAGDLITLTHFSDFRTLFPLVNGTTTLTAHGAEDINHPGLDPLDYAFAPFNNLTTFGEERADLTTREIFVGQANPDDFVALTDIAAMDSVVLTAGQADYAPFLPGTQHMVAGSDIGTNDLVRWITVPPIAWTPIFLFELPAPAGVETWTYQPPDSFPVDAEPAFMFDLTRMDPFAFEKLFGNVGVVGAGPDHMLQRWPIEERAVMYVSANNENVLAGTKPDSFFIWDADDGLENGEYDVYVETAANIDALRNRIEADAQTGFPDSPPAEINDLLTPLVSDQENFAPNLSLLRYLPEREFERFDDLRVDLEFFSERDPNQRILPDPTIPEDQSFGRQTNLTPNSDGLIYYGVVRVEGNYLAMRIVNKAPDGLLNRFSRVILAPRNRTPGRININTAETRLAAGFVNPNNVDQVNLRFFNPLGGIPGFLGGVDGFDVNNRVNPAPLAYPGTTAPPTVEQYRNAFGAFSTSLSAANVDILRRANTVAESRTEYADGRYYEFVGDLVRNRQLGRAPLATLHSLATDPTLGGSVILHDTVLSQLFNPGTRLDEIRERLSRAANLATTRSDVYEIIVTVQAGYGVDANGDGRQNYRDPFADEFIITSEQQARMVYER